MNAGTIPIELRGTLGSAGTERRGGQEQGQPSPEAQLACRSGALCGTCMCSDGILLGAGTNHAEQHDCADDQGAQEQIPSEHHAGQEDCGNDAGKNAMDSMFTHGITPFLRYP